MINVELEAVNVEEDDRIGDRDHHKPKLILRSDKTSLRGDLYGKTNNDQKTNNIHNTTKRAALQIS